jgi:hypothetical protein
MFLIQQNQLIRGQVFDGEFNLLFTIGRVRNLNRDSIGVLISPSVPEIQVIKAFSRTARHIIKRGKDRIGFLDGLRLLAGSHRGDQEDRQKQENKTRRSYFHTTGSDKDHGFFSFS